MVDYKCLGALHFMNRSDSGKTLIQPVMSALNDQGKLTSVDVSSLSRTSELQSITPDFQSTV
jgi:hypothetical protein